LRCAGLPIGLFSQDKILLTTEEFFALYRGIAEVSRDPAIGLKLGTEDRMERYDPIAIAAVCTRSFRDAVDRIGRYKQLTCPEKIALVERGNESAVHFTWLLAHEEEPALLVDVCFAWILSIARRGTGRSIHPKRVEFQRPEANRAIYEKHFQCPIRFRAARNVLVFNKADMDAAFLTSNADLLAAVAPQLEAELKQQLMEKNFREQVKGTLKRQLAGERPAIEHVARELRLSKRTLQRRLTEDGITFQQLMEEARRELARHYLLHSSLELNETAYLLGYEDANSFFRAFHEWEGTSPGEWRTVHMASA
jgi:AraC-like DNA-binding protein